MKTNVVCWFEVPVTDIDRAIAFYSTVFGYELQAQQFGDEIMAWFPWAEGKDGASGSLVYHKEKYTPSEHGVTIYFSAPSEDLANELSRVENAGGKIIQEKTHIAEGYGYYALIIDTEGNRIGLHSKK